MICAPEAAIREKARKMPVGYLAECQAASRPNNKGEWCFDSEAYAAIANKYARYTLSEADPYRTRISGCCDRADQH